MNINYYIILPACLFLSFLSCSDMNDMHDKYLRDGEITYIGRIDSIQVYPGRERALLNYWITDPRAKRIEVTWRKEQEVPLEIIVPTHDPLDPLEVMIGDGNTPINEGDYTFVFISYDDRGHRSIRFETLIIIYGDRYQATLSNRSLRSAIVKDNKQLQLEFGGSNSLDETGIEITYTDINGVKHSVFVETADLDSLVILTDVDINQSIQYQTWFKPEENAIDSFSASPVTIESIINEEEEL